MSLLLLLNPSAPPHTGANPDVELDTFLLSANSPEAHVDAVGPGARIVANDPSSHALVNDPFSGVVGR